MKFDDMNPVQRRLHNAACVLGADGDEHGFEQLQRDAIAEIELLRATLRAVLSGNVGQQTMARLAAGQGTATMDGQAWLSAAALVLGPNSD